MNQIKTAVRSMNEVTQVVLVLAMYLLVFYISYAILEGTPGEWAFTLVVALPLPIALYSLRLGALQMRGNITPITEGMAVSAAMGLAMVALIGTHPGITGTVRYLPATLSATLLIAVAEEALFRGALLPVLARRFGFLWGILISSLLFGALHAQSGIGSGLTAVMAGLALGGLYVRSGLGMCIAFHAVFNMICGPVMGLNVGGMVWPGLLEPAMPHDPLGSVWVQLGFLFLLLLWIPWQMINRRD